MVSRNEICSVIPAAGKGSRLGGNCPKIFTEIYEKKTIWNILNSKLNKFIEHHCLVLNPDSYRQYGHKITPETKISIQKKPIGMGDAIFQGYEHWSLSPYVLIVWGDQVHVSEETIKKVIDSFGENENQIVLPIVRQEKPYVEYIFSSDKLVEIKQSREGDITTPNGYSDIGVFGLSTSGLKAHWENFSQKNTLGSGTGEINFLPFLVYLSNVANWEIFKIIIDDVDESRGINTPEDLNYFRDKYSKR